VFFGLSSPISSSSLLQAKKPGPSRPVNFSQGARKFFKRSPILGISFFFFFNFGSFFPPPRDNLFFFPKKKTPKFFPPFFFAPPGNPPVLTNGPNLGPHGTNLLPWREISNAECCKENVDGARLDIWTIPKSSRDYPVLRRDVEDM